MMYSAKVILDSRALSRNSASSRAIPLLKLLKQVEELSSDDDAQCKIWWLEPWMWITVIVSATNWKNFFKRRYLMAVSESSKSTSGWLQYNKIFNNECADETL